MSNHFDRRLRILVGADVPCDPDSGASGTVYQTNQALRELGHEVDEIWAEDLGRRIQHGNLHYLIELPSSYKRVLRAHCRDQCYDVIQLSQPQAFLAAIDHHRQKRKGIFVNRSHGVELRAAETLNIYRSAQGDRKGVSARAIASSLVQSALNLQWPKLLSAVDGMIVGCEEDRKYIHEKLGVEGKRIQAISHGVAPVFLQEHRLGFDSKRLQKILYIGQFAEFKAPQLLVSIVDAILLKNSAATFTWVCDKNNHPQALAMFDQRVVSRVKMLNLRSQEKLRCVLDEHGVFLFPSLFEGFGKAPLEAMSRGLCVVASNTGGMRDYILSGENGMLAAVGDLKGFVSAVNVILDNQKLAETISNRAIEQASRFTWQKCAAKAIEFYRFLLVQKSGRNNG